MRYRIEELDFEFCVVGIKQPVVTKKAFKIIPTLWREAKNSGLTQELIDMSWKNPKCKVEGLLGICGDKATIQEEEFNYFMGVRYDEEVPDNMEKILIPKCTWAVFESISDGWKNYYEDLVIKAGYELNDLPCIECYYAPKHKPRNELWVPIKKSN